jgi:4-amino-4-deoxy-L-arabinose transferase-like glycosyltransferase
MLEKREVVDLDCKLHSSRRSLLIDGILQKRAGSLSLLSGLVLADALVLLGGRSPLLSLLGAALLFCLLPGLALVRLLFPRSDHPGLLSKLLLAVALSYVLSNSIVLFLNLVPGGMDLGRLIVALSLVSVGLTIPSVPVAPARQAGVKATRRVRWLHVAILLTLLVFFRFVGLGYAEFILSDEISVISTTLHLIEGESSALLARGKPPIETTTATAFVLFSGGYSEFAMRFPFALASMVSVLMVYVLGQKMFSERAGFLAASLLALEGIYLAVSRFTQYQGIVLLMASSSVYCFWEARSVQTRRGRAQFLLLGSLFFAFGCLAHYDMLVVVPVLVILCLSTLRLRVRRDRLLLLACVLLILGIAAPFYIPFTFSGNLSHLLAGRVGGGRGLFNHVRTFVISEMLFRNSVYYVFLMSLTILGAVVTLCRKTISSLPVFVSWVALLVGLLMSICCPHWAQVGSINFAILLFLPIFIVLLLTRRVSLEDRIIWLWFTTAVILYGFVIFTPGLHWYNIFPAWCLISGVFVDRALVSLGDNIDSKTWLILTWATYLTLVVLFGGYLYVFFIQQVPEYAVDFPSHASSLYWTPPQTDPGGRERPIYGAPRQAGWKVIKMLYQAGILRGHLRSSAGRDILEWYMEHQWDWDESSRYVLYTDSPAFTLQTSYRGEADLDLEAIEQSASLVGRVVVRGVPKILIFESAELAPSQPVEDYHFGEYGSLYDREITLEQRLRYNEIEVNSKTYYQAAGLIENTSRPDDTIVFTDRHQVGLFSYHYHGGLPYRIPNNSFSPNEVEQWLAGRPPGAKSYILLWAVQNSPDRKMWDTWLDQRQDVVERAWHGNVGLAIHNPSGVGQLHLLGDTRLGEAVELLGYRVEFTPERQGISLTLFWTASRHPTKDYTVFTHLVDETGQVFGQEDNQPVGGTRPTTTWRTDQVLQDSYTIPFNGIPEAGEHWIEIGMYDATTGQRLPTSGEDALPDGRIRLITPGLIHPLNEER